MMEDPCEILGVPKDAPISVIRSRYLQLAKAHHPDKLAALSPEEKLEHEEFFKKVAASYHYLCSENEKGKKQTTQSKQRTRDGNENSDSGNEEESNRKLFDWRNIWGTFFGGVSVTDLLKDVMNDYLDRTPRYFSVTMTLEELHHKKKRAL